MADILSLDDADYKMADLECMKNECNEMLMYFKNHLISYDPAEMDGDEWDYKLNDALVDIVERMTNRHWVRLGTDGSGSSSLWSVKGSIMLLSMSNPLRR